MYPYSSTKIKQLNKVNFAEFLHNENKNIGLVL